MVNYPIQHQVDEDLFFVALDDGQRAYVKYRHSANDSAVRQVDFYSTFVPDDYRGEGLAAKLVNHGFDWAENQGLHIEASCWYAAKIAKRRARNQTST